MNSNLNARPNSTSLLDRLPQGSNPDEILEGFVAWATEAGLTLYPAQEEAILELLAGNHVILATPTGSGKSLVATAAHAAALARGERSAYTAPIKALVSEKFFALARDFGSDNVGMVTGDASVNPGAPIIACTAEILAHRALREGRSCDVGLVVADEFHYYADPQRGWAWQVPLLELTDTQFLLMSATLGPTTRFEDDLTERTGRPTVTVAGTERPVPLTFEYRETPLHESITELVDSDRAPIYIVHFTQKAATERLRTSAASTWSPERRRPRSARRSVASGSTRPSARTCAASSATESAFTTPASSPATGYSSRSWPRLAFSS